MESLGAQGSRVSARVWGGDGLALLARGGPAMPGCPTPVPPVPHFFNSTPSMIST